MPKLPKSTQSSHPIANQLLQFLTRQINTLKNIDSQFNQTHPDITKNRLQECICVLEKRLALCVAEGQEQYQDYIQDFYEGQLNSLRNELNDSMLKLAAKDRNIESLQIGLDMLKSQDKFSQGLQLDANEVVCLKKQLDHSRLLLAENNTILAEQNDTIGRLSKQLRSKEKSEKESRRNYEERILRLDNAINANRQKFEVAFVQLSDHQRTAQYCVKEMSLNSLKAIEDSSVLSKQLEIKIEQIKLLTKKLFESEVLISKYERGLALKQKMIEEASQQLNMLRNDSQDRAEKEQKHQRVLEERSREISKLEQRVQLLNGTNSELKAGIEEKTRAMQAIQQQIKNISKQRDVSANQFHDLEAMFEENKHVLASRQSDLQRVSSKNEQLMAEIQLIQTKYDELCQQAKMDKENMKNSIMGEVSEIVSISKVQKDKIEKLTRRLREQDQANRELQQLNVGLESKFLTISEAMTDITHKMESLEAENADIQQACNILQLKCTNQVEELEKYVLINKEYELAQKEKEIAEKKLKEIESQGDQLLNQKITEMNHQITQLHKQQKDYKELICSKDFQLKQYESKTKILQQDLRTVSTLYENEKAKMAKKIKQLEELLKEDLSSRRSNNQM